MSERRTNTKQRMLDSAISLLRERGSRGVTIDAVLADSGTPRGSVYHHFPGGRDQLLAEATQTATDFISLLIAEVATDPDTALDRFIDLWCTVLVDSDFRAGCPIAGVTMAAEGDIDSTRDAFAVWRNQIADLYEIEGLSADDAASLATSTVAAVEGAILLSRAERSTRPMDDVRRMLHAFRSTLPAGSDPI